MTKWKKIHISEFPFEIFSKDIIDEIDSLIVLYRLIGWDVRTECLLFYEDNRYSIEFIYNGMKVLLLLVLRKDNITFVSCEFSFFAMDITAQKKINQQYGSHGAVNDVNEVTNILKNIKDILDELETLVI